MEIGFRVLNFSVATQNNKASDYNKEKGANLHNSNSIWEPICVFRVKHQYYRLLVPQIPSEMMRWEQLTQGSHSVARYSSPFNLPVGTRVPGDGDEIVGHNCYGLLINALWQIKMQPVTHL